MDPRMQTALIYFYLDEPWKYAKEIGAETIHGLYPFVTQTIVQGAKKNGVKIVPYTVDQWNDIARMMQLKVTGIITNYPGRVRKYIEHLKV
jgi:glycerophosphoryl diester phosphodiesterase